MATWREALDNVRAGNVALSDNHRFGFAPYHSAYQEFDFDYAPPIICEIDIREGIGTENKITFRDGSYYGFYYYGASGNQLNIKVFAKIQNYPILGQTPKGTDYSWLSGSAVGNHITVQVGGQTIRADVKKIGMAFGCNIGEDNFISNVFYGKYAENLDYGYMWNWDYTSNNTTANHGEMGYLQSDSHVVDFLAGEQAEPEHFPGDPSGSGGGTGWFISENDTIDIPPLPSIQAIDFGFSTLYNPTTAQMQSIAAWLWSDDFDENIKLNFVSPFENIIALSLIPWGLTTVAGILRIGNVDSNIPVARVVKQYEEVDCGSINVLEFWGSFLDYNATYSIWLPYIGFRSLKPDDMVNGTIGVVYHIDILTGCVVAYIWTIKEDGIKHVLYTYSGNMNYNVAFSGANFMAMYNQQLSATTSGINNAVQSVGKALSGDITGAVDLLTGQAQAKRQYETAKPDYGRGGNGSGGAGIFGIRYPYIVQCLPIGQAPDNYMGLNGVPSQTYAKLSTLSGYTEIDRVIVNTLTCTEDEQKQIVALLKEGVIL